MDQKNFTVVLQRTFELTDALEIENEEAQYVALVTGDFEDYVEVFQAGQKQAYEADLPDLRHMGYSGQALAKFSRSCYLPLMIFEGHHTPKIFSFSPEAQECK